MDNRFFERPILTSLYEYPVRHWELDVSGQPTQQIIETRRPAKYITPSKVEAEFNRIIEGVYTNIGVDKSCNSR